MSFDPVSAIADLANTVISRVWPDKTEAEKEAFTLALQKELSANSSLLGQLQIDSNEASSPSVFVAGWRPAMGWVCVSAFFWQFVAVPVCVFVSASVGHPLALPSIDTASMMQILMGMLGLGSMRTFEKYKNVQGNH